MPRQQRDKQHGHPLLALNSESWSVHLLAVPTADLPPASSPRSRPGAAPLLAAVLDLANVAKVKLPLDQDKTAAVLAELRRPTDDNELKKSERVSSDCPTDKISGISAFSQAPVSELLVSPCIPHVAVCRV